MITVVVGKRRNTTPWFSAVGEKKTHEPQPQIARYVSQSANKLN